MREAERVRKRERERDVSGSIINTADLQPKPDTQWKPKRLLQNWQ